MNEIVHVAVAAIVNKKNEVLVSKRAEQSHQGGLWEFPGGKMEKNETVEQALIRETNEELGIQPTSFRPLIKVAHQYVDKKVLLDVWRVDDFQGEPAGLEGQPVCWQPVNKLEELAFPAADVAIARALNLPEHYLITGNFETEQEFESRLQHAIDGGIKLIQLRLTEQWLSKTGAMFAMKIVEIAVELSAQFGLTLMFNLPDAVKDEVNTLINQQPGSSHGSYGIHLNSRKLGSISKRPPCALLSASCHNLQELKKAQELAVDFAVLSPVKPTASHPDTKPLGWNRFSELVDQIGLPVYALGGVNRADTEQSWHAGGQGVAAISGFWIEQPGYK